MTKAERDKLWEQLEFYRDAETHHHSCACGKCFSDKTNFRAVVKTLATECLTLKDYIDTLELVLLRADTALSDTAGFAEKIDARTTIHQALAKGK